MFLQNTKTTNKNSMDINIDKAITFINCGAFE